MRSVLKSNFKNCTVHCCTKIFITWRSPKQFPTPFLIIQLPGKWIFVLPFWRATHISFYVWLSMRIKIFLQFCFTHFARRLRCDFNTCPPKRNYKTALLKIKLFSQKRNNNLPLTIPPFFLRHKAPEIKKISKDTPFVLPKKRRMGGGGSVGNSPDTNKYDRDIKILGYSFFNLP